MNKLYIVKNFLMLLLPLLFVSQDFMQAEPSAVPAKKDMGAFAKHINQVAHGWKGYLSCLKGSASCSQKKRVLARAVTGLAVGAGIGFGAWYLKKHKKDAASNLYQEQQMLEREQQARADFNQVMQDQGCSEGVRLYEFDQRNNQLRINLNVDLVAKTDQSGGFIFNDAGYPLLSDTVERVIQNLKGKGYQFFNYYVYNSKTSADGLNLVKNDPDWKEVVQKAEVDKDGNIHIVLNKKYKEQNPDFNGQYSFRSDYNKASKIDTIIGALRCMGNNVYEVTVRWED